MDFVDSVGRNMTTGAFAQISGRAGRSEYWWFMLFTFLVVSAIGLLGSVAEGPLVAIPGIIVMVPGITLGVRRMHDIGMSGWWLLVWLIPLVGLLTLIYLLTKGSEMGANKWGETERA